jgi:HAD superfamily hydrolase (TIGR01509 family)
VLGVPLSHEPPADELDQRLQRRPLEAVLFDFHGTIAQVEDSIRWVTEAAAACGVALDRGRATVLADRFTTAGRAGGPLPHRVPPPLAEVWADRDLYEHAHRAAYTGLAATVDSGIEGLPEALYARLLTPDGWHLYEDALPTLKALRAAEVPVAVVSNVGFDLRTLAGELGFAEYVDEFVLSYEVGRCKPDPAIFLKACAVLRADPERTLMVGDSPADAGAAAAGCSVLVLPASDPGRRHGLAAALRLL